jgi:hypothetical protein
MVYTVDLLGDANLRVRDLTITRNTYLANVVVDASADLNSVTTVGNTTTNSIEITSAQASTSKLTGALKVSGGVGVQGNVHVGSNLFVESNLEVGTANLFVDTTTGNVGIGTTNPQGLLHISSGTSGDAHLILEADTNNNNETDNPKIVFKQDGGYYIGEIGLTNNQMAFRNKTGSGGGFIFYSNVGAGSTTDINELEDTQVEVMRITGDGNVGIGTASPSVPLHVSSSNFVSDAVGPASSSNNVFRVTSTEVDSTLLVGASETGSYISSFSKASFANEKNLILNANGGNVGIGTTNPTSKLYIQDDNADTKMTIRGGGNAVNDSNVSIELLETPANFYGATIQYCGTLATQGLRFGHHVNTATPRLDMAIDRSSGNVGINDATPSYKLDVNGTLRCFGFTNSSSDDRIKYNEQNVSNALTLISQLKPQKYEKIMERPNPSEGTWIPTDDEWENVKENYKYGDEFGFIAQDVREVPELAFLVNGEETRTDTKRSTLEEYSNLTTEEQSTYTISYLHESNVITQEEYSNLTPEEQEASVAQYTKEIETQTPLSLNYNGLFVLAIGAIQELKAKNDALEARILALEGAS